MNKETTNTKVSLYNLVKNEPVKNSGISNKFINWVSGEFDLYLIDESEILKVYFPNGWFIIRNFKGDENQNHIEIKVESKSRIACQKMMDKLEVIYNHVIRFTIVREN